MAKSDTAVVCGKHAVRAALQGEKPVQRVWLAESLNPHVRREFQALAKEKGVLFQVAPHRRLEQMFPGMTLQGIVAEVGAREYTPWDEFLEHVYKQGAQALVVVLDQIQDPHNLGAIIRTVEVAGAHGVIIPKHESVGLTEGVAKASSGAIERVPVACVTNLSRSLEALKKTGLWVIGFSLGAGTLHFKANLTGPLALVFGNEHKGLRPNVEKHCDQLVQIPMVSPISLNASTAAAVGLYEVVRQRAAVMN